MVAEAEGEIIGSNFLDEHDPIRGLGPVTVDPQVQVRVIGRRLMKTVLEQARGAVGVRLLQDSFNMLSVSLYASFGFEVKEPLLLMRGRVKDKPGPGVEVRPLSNEDLSETAALCKKVHGFERFNEMQDALEGLSPVVAVHDGRITAYALNIRVWPRSHAVAESDGRNESAVAGRCIHEFRTAVSTLAGEASELVSLVLSPGVQSRPADDIDGDGNYYEPDGCYFPSILY